ncbi:hypothetical protein P7C70_g1879, partial [Phenoliferia sp. Uapishka_3]
MAALFNRAYERGVALTKSALARYEALPQGGKIAVWAYVAIHVLFGAAVWIITPVKLLEQVAQWGKELQGNPYGWVLLLGLIILTSFPPLFGYGTCITLCDFYPSLVRLCSAVHNLTLRRCGFAFGVWRGWMLGALGCVLGSLISFSITRQLVGWFAPYLGRDKTFRALAAAVRVKGLPLVVLIRLCPFPFTYSNLFFASIESVSGAYVVVGSALGAFTSWYLYQLTMKYVEDINLDDEGQDLEAAGLVDDIDAMLEEDDEETSRPTSPFEDDATTPRAESRSPAYAAVPLPPAKSTTSKSTKSPKSTPIPLTPYRDSPRESLENGQKSGRPSEDWGGTFSDFEDDHESKDEEDDGEDPLGLGLPPSVSRPVPVHAVDKRRD